MEDSDTPGLNDRGIKDKNYDDQMKKLPKKFLIKECHMQSCFHSNKI